MTNIHNAYIDNGHVTVRQFANNNDLNVQSLRNLVRHDDNIHSSFIKNGTKHYQLPKMNIWLIANKHKFEEGHMRAKKPSILQDNEFYCGGCGEYKEKVEKSTALYCVECSSKRTKPIFVHTGKLTTGEGVVSNRCGIAAIMEKRALDDVISDTWMND
jgi:NADH pyrophosphatase NudC (nudix superfamily)